MIWTLPSVDAPHLQGDMFASTNPERMLIFPTPEERRSVLRNVPDRDGPSVRAWSLFLRGEERAALSRWAHCIERDGRTLLFNALGLRRMVGGAPLAALFDELVRLGGITCRQFMALARPLGDSAGALDACIEGGFLALPGKEELVLESYRTRAKKRERAQPAHLEILLDGRLQRALLSPRSIVGALRAFPGEGAPFELKVDVAVRGAVPGEYVRELMSFLVSRHREASFSTALSLDANELGERATAPLEGLFHEIHVHFDSPSPPRAARDAFRRARSESAGLLAVVNVGGSAGRNLPQKITALAGELQCAEILVRSPEKSAAGLPGRTRARLLCAAARSLRDVGVRELGVERRRRALIFEEPSLAGCRIGGSRFAVDGRGRTAWCLPLLREGMTGRARSRENTLAAVLPVFLDRCRRCPALGLCGGACRASSHERCEYTRTLVEELLGELLHEAGALW